MFMYNMYCIPGYTVCACTINCTKEPVIFCLFLKEIKKDQVKSYHKFGPVSHGTCLPSVSQHTSDAFLGTNMLIVETTSVFVRGNLWHCIYLVTTLMLMFL